MFDKLRDYGKTYHFDLPKTGVHRARFILEGVGCLRERCRSLGGDLTISVRDVTVDV